MRTMVVLDKMRRITPNYLGNDEGGDNEKKVQAVKYLKI